MNVALRDPRIERPAQQHLGFVDFQKALEIHKWRNGRFTNSDCTNRLALDQRDLQLSPGAQAGQRSRGHPASSAAA